MGHLPESLAIAGAWGYIGRKFLAAAVRRHVPTFVYDPGVVPNDIDPNALTRMMDEAEFYRLPADLFHLATHPEHRRIGQQILFQRAQREPLSILNEKPMAGPESPEDCNRIVAAAHPGHAITLYDFPELYDPLTERIIERLCSYREVTVTDIALCRSKDREAPDNPRNYKRMVPIQYQESVHCMAFVLFVLARVGGNVAERLAGGVSLRAESEPYVPPNPELYPYVVDGRCRYRFSLDGVRIEGLTDFKAGAQLAKRRVLRGRGDGRPFCIEVDYLEGCKRLSIDGVEQTIDPRADSYESVLGTFVRWRRETPREDLMAGIYPNPAFARITYQLSSALWRASRDRAGLQFAHLDDVLQFDAGFREALPRLPRYG